MSNKLDQQTILDFKAGDRKAFELVFNRYYVPIVVFAKKITDNQAEAEDIAIDVLSKLFQRNNHFDSELNIRAFLYVSARNKCLDYFDTVKRKNNKYNEFTAYIQDDTLLEYEYTIKDDLVEAIFRAIEKLPEECRKVFKMLYYEELKPVEIASILQISVNTVYSQKSRAVKALKLRLENFKNT